MFGRVRKAKRVVRDRTVYMEVFGDNKVWYRVVAGRMSLYGNEVITYGIEAEDRMSGERAAIPDFSGNIEDAVSFVEMLITAKVHPSKLYCCALNYLCMSI